MIMPSLIIRDALRHFVQAAQVAALNPFSWDEWSSGRTGRGSGVSQTSVARSILRPSYVRLRYSRSPAETGLPPL
jgi:hypothetical protein